MLRLGPCKGKVHLATVLTIDRDVLQLEVLASVLKHEGHRVHPTTDPQAGLAVLQTSFIDLVVIEPATLRPDGLRFCQHIRQLNPYRPLMIVSERGDEEQIFRSLMIAADVRSRVTQSADDGDHPRGAFHARDQSFVGRRFDFSANLLD